MSEKAGERNGDVALLLYAIPFIVPFAYALYLWVGVGLSATLPPAVYLETTQSPYVFLAGFAAVILASIIDFDAESPTSRKSSLGVLSRRLQAIAFLALVLAIISALYASGFDVTTWFTDLLSGQYALVFPALLVLFSFLILPAFKTQGMDTNNIAIIVLLIASPAAIYELGKRNTALGLGVGLIFLLAAAFLLVRNKK